MDDPLSGQKQGVEQVGTGRLEGATGIGRPGPGQELDIGDRAARNRVRREDASIPELNKLPTRIVLERPGFLERWDGPQSVLTVLPFFPEKGPETRGPANPSWPGGVNYGAIY